VRSFKVEIEHQGSTIALDIPEGKSILEVALDKGMDLPHDCELGVCMTCPAKLVRLHVQHYQNITDPLGLFEKHHHAGSLTLFRTAAHGMCRFHGEVNQSGSMLSGKMLLERVCPFVHGHSNK